MLLYFKVSPMYICFFKFCSKSDPIIIEHFYGIEL